MAAPVLVTKTTNGRFPSLPFNQMKNSILGEDYELSLVFAGAHRMRTLNTTYRKKTYSANTLSFPLHKKAGEIFINVDRIAREAKQHGMRQRVYIAYLFIHGLFHLKGMRHSATMERKEREALCAFEIC